MNPVFLWLLLGALLSIEYLLRAKLFKNREPARKKFITFISDRRRLTLELDAIMYIESRDYEVRVVASDGTKYPTRMKISQWEAVLDDGFVRVHRSFIVNRAHITRFDAHTLRLGGVSIEISRKYRENLSV
jgi:DNA-binding LytR/AlgR family response regulator